MKSVRAKTMYDPLLTWKQNIVDVCSDGRWKSRRQIKNALGLDHGIDPNLTRCLSSYIIQLVRTGHLERAFAPEQLKADPLDHVMYVYRRTKKKLELNVKGYARGSLKTASTIRTRRIKSRIVD